MRLHYVCVLCLLLLLIYGFSSSNGDGFESDNSGIVSWDRHWVDFKGSTRAGGRSLKSILHSEDSTELVALLNGTIYLEDKITGRVLWSFSSGEPMYSSYQAPFRQDNGKENIFGPSSGFFVDYGDDWQLYAHGKHSSGMKLSMNIEDFIKITPHISEDGAVILGSKKTTVFVVEAKTGRLIRTYKSSDSPSTLQSNEEGSSLYDDDKNNKDLVVSGSTNTAQVIYITRTDYALQTFGPNSGKVSWSMKVAAIEAAFLCKDDENPAATLNSSYEIGSEDGSDFWSCQSRRMVVRRQDKPRSFSGAIDGDEKLPFPSSDLMLLSQSMVDKSLDDHHERMMLPGSAPTPALPVQSKVDNPSHFHSNNNNEGMLALPNVSLAVDMHDASMPQNDALSMFFWWCFAFFVSLILLCLVLYLFALLGKGKDDLKGESSSFNSKSFPSKRKKSRKLGKNNGSAETKDNHISTGDGDRFAVNEGDDKMYLDLNKFVECGANGRRIGKLIVTETEIAKGSNGTIVLEGVYDGRPVAVKRLVKTHHDVAFKEIQNLIASDRHPNIVRWYGVEYDKDFVYLSLERCTCSLDDLIQIDSDSSLNPLLGNDQTTQAAIEYKLRLDSVKGIMGNLKLWKANGHPSPQLFTLIRDMVSGLAHLHELGIIHRDLKPQNVLIIKERSLCAKLSDMGISKRLIGDMSSLGHHATGCGSSGWQSPEQLLHGRQTRAVDLFSLGCVLFFCLTGGRHPFGDRLERDINIVKNQLDLFLVEYIPEAVDLISHLLNPDPGLRPKALEVLPHPLFWSSEMRLSFFRDISDRVELEDRQSDSDLLKALEGVAPTALGGKWDERMEPTFITNIGHYRRYKFDSVRDLLRVMRNKLNHYRELPKEIQELLGPIPDGYDGYFSSRFPKLLIEVYKIVCKYCREDECFRKYFESNNV